MISDSIVMVFSTRLACDRPHIAFAIALGLVIVASIDEWIYTFAKQLLDATSQAARLSKETGLAQGVTAVARVGTAGVTNMAKNSTLGVKAMSAAIAPTIAGIVETKGSEDDPGLRVCEA